LPNNIAIETEGGRDIISSYLVDPNDPTWPNDDYITIGNDDSLVSFAGTIFQPFVIKNDSAIQAWDSSYGSKANLMSRWSDEVVVIGDQGVTSAIRSDMANGVDPVVRDGDYGSTTDYALWHDGNRKAIDPGDSTATDIDTLRDDYNTLLANLRTAGIIG
jgi:hypothetical protein